MAQERIRLESVLIPADEVEREWSEMVLNMQSRLLAMPCRLAGVVVGMKSRREIQEVIADAVHEALLELSNDLQRDVDSAIEA